MVADGGLSEHEREVCTFGQAELPEVEETGLLDQGEVHRVIEHASGVDVLPPHGLLACEAVIHGWSLWMDDVRDRA